MVFIGITFLGLGRSPIDRGRVHQVRCNAAKPEAFRYDWAGSLLTSCVSGGGISFLVSRPVIFLLLLVSTGGTFKMKVGTVFVGAVVVLDREFAEARMPVATFLSSVTSRLYLGPEVAKAPASRWVRFITRLAIN